MLIFCLVCSSADKFKLTVHESWRLDELGEELVVVPVGLDKRLGGELLVLGVDLADFQKYRSAIHPLRLLDILAYLASHRLLNALLCISSVFFFVWVTLVFFLKGKLLSRF
jgi:hypothetical protein